MPCRHEFGIIDCWEEYDEGKYETEKTIVFLWMTIF